MDDQVEVVDNSAEVVEQVVSETEQHEQVEDTTPPEKPKDEPIPRGVQKRIDRAVRQKYEAEARANEFERRLRELEQAKPAAKDEGAPRLDQFDNIEDYVEAKARYVAKNELKETLTAQEKREMERRAQEAQARTSETWAKRAAAAKAEMPDFDEVVSSSDIQFRDPAVIDVIKESEFGPKIAYYLASNPDEADEIADMTGAAAIRAIGRLEAKLEGGKVSVTKAPAPIKPVGQKAKVDKSPEEMSPDEFAKWRKKYISTRGSR